jgi:Fe2+ transport system protein FeoA
MPVEPGQPALAVEPGVEQVPQAVRGEPIEPQAVTEPGALPPPVAPPPPSSANVPTIFAQRGSGMTSMVGIEAMDFRAVRRAEFYSGGFLTEDQELPWGRSIGTVGSERLRRLPESSFASVFEYIAVLPPLGGTYQVGDSLLLGSLLREVPEWGEVFSPTGVARVTEVTADGAVAQVLMQFGLISDDQLVLPLEPFRDPGQVLPVPVTNGMMGSIITPRQLNPVPSQQQVVFIDLGRNAGVALGDMFAVLKADKGEGMSPREIAYLRIVHVRDQSATGLIVNVADIGIVAGAPVQLIRKMP